MTKSETVFWIAQRIPFSGVRFDRFLQDRTRWKTKENIMFNPVVLIYGFLTLQWT